MKTNLQLISKFLFFILVFNIYLFGNTKFQMLSGEYTLSLKATDSNESYPIDMTLYIDNYGKISKANVSYPTYQCKAILKNSFSDIDFGFKEKMIQGFDSCSPSTFFIFANSKYYFNPYIKKHLTLKSFDGEENVRIDIIEYKYTSNSFANFRIKNSILNISDFFTTKNSKLLRKALTLVDKKQLRKDLNNYLNQLLVEEKQEFNTIIKSKDLHSLNSYIKTYTGSQYIPKVKNKIALVKKENLIKKFRLEKNPKSFYEAYLLSKDKYDVKNILTYFNNLDKLLEFLEGKNELINEKLTQAKLLKFYREKNDIESLIKAYNISNQKADLIAAYEKISKSKNKIVLNNSLVSSFFDSYVSNFDYAIRFINIIDKFKSIDKNKYFNKIIKLEDFSKDFQITTFLDSIEYKYLLKKIKPQIKFIAKDNTSYLNLKYFDNNIMLFMKNYCSYSHQISKEKDLGFAEVLLGAGMKYSSKTLFYDIYLCKIDDKEIDQINLIYNKTYGYVEKNKYSWKKSLYSHKKFNEDTNAKNKSMCYSIKNQDTRNLCLGKYDKNTCFSIKNQDTRNLCLGKYDKTTCFSIKNQDTRNLCLGKYDKNTCYSIKNQDTRNLCLGKYNKSTCFSIKNQDKRNLCLGTY